MKRVILILIAACILFSFCACGNSSMLESTENDEASQRAQDAKERMERIDDILEQSREVGRLIDEYNNGR